MLASRSVPHKPKADKTERDGAVVRKAVRKAGQTGTLGARDAASGAHPVANAVGDVNTSSNNGGSPPAALSTTSADSPKVPSVSTAKLSPVGVFLGQNTEEAQQALSPVSSGSRKTRVARAAAHLVPAACMATSLRRERDVMDPALYHQLCYERLMLRQDPGKGLNKGRRSYVYYNHRSKGCYIPHEKDPFEMTLTYNHMYNFGDGSRFLSPDGVAPRVNPNVGDVLHHNCNVSSKGGTSNDHRGCRSSGGTLRPKTSEQPRRTRSSITSGRRTVAVDLARSLQLRDIRAQPFQIRKSVEDVISSDLRCVERAREGISSVVGKGKVSWSDVPEALANAFSEVQAQSAGLGSRGFQGGKRANSPGYRAGSTPTTSSGEALNYLPASSLPVRAEGSRITCYVPRSSVSNRGQSSPQKPVSFTDHADRVLLGFTANACVPGNSQGEESAPCNRPSGQRLHPHDNNGTHTVDAWECVPLGADVNHFPGVPQEDCSDEAGKLGTTEGGKLLPRVATAQLRDGDYFLPTAIRPVPETVMLLGPKWLPDRQLPYETSRLSYLRKFDVGDAKPPPNMVHWTLSKKLH